MPLYRDGLVNMSESYYYAVYDPAAAAPQPVLHWLNNANGRTTTLPPVAAEPLPNGTVKVDAATWALHLQHLDLDRWTIVAGVATLGSGNPESRKGTPHPFTLLEARVKTLEYEVAALKKLKGNT